MLTGQLSVVSSSGVHPVEHPGEGDGFADMINAANPGHDALHAHSETGVGHASILAQVKIPLESFSGEMVLFDAL